MTLDKLIENIFRKNINDNKAVIILKDLMNKGTTLEEIEELNYIGYSLLGTACKFKFIETVKFLIGIGCNVNLKVCGFFNTEPPLIAASCRKNNSEIIELLLNNNALIDIRSEYDYTALMHICSYGYGDLETVKLLLKYGADVNFRNSSGLTALIIASMWGYDDIIKELLKNGANPNIVDNYGKTAYDYAKDKNLKSTCKLLKNYEKYRNEESTDIHIKSEEEINAAVKKLAMKLGGV